MVRAQRGLDHAQVGQELGRSQVRVLRRDGVAQRLGAGQLVQRGGQARIDAGQRTPVGFVQAVLVGVGRTFGQRLHGWRDRRQQRRHRQLAAQQVHLGQVEAQHHLGLPLGPLFLAQFRKDTVRRQPSFGFKVTLSQESFRLTSTLQSLILIRFLRDSPTWLGIYDLLHNRLTSMLSLFAWVLAR